MENDCRLSWSYPILPFNAQLDETNSIRARDIHSHGRCRRGETRRGEGFLPFSDGKPGVLRRSIQTMKHLQRELADLVIQRDRVSRASAKFPVHTPVHATRSALSRLRVTQHAHANRYRSPRAHNIFSNLFQKIPFLPLEFFILSVWIDCERT